MIKSIGMYREVLVFGLHRLFMVMSSFLPVASHSQCEPYACHETTMVAIRTTFI
ncbi:MAG TPA: hypothetical protein VKM55_10045 [Candidatus Lokiarchaeia archaeon]|nr:hypothetical protein [Candidatus Lokiarchaeia archaeon]